MTTTPTFWKTQFTVNAASTAGSKNFAAPIGLADGTLITGFFADGNVGAGASGDVIAQRLDAQANFTGGLFQLNTVSTADDERIGDMEPLPGGGFVLAYVDTEGASADIIRLERFDANGAVVFSTFVAAGGTVSDPELGVAANGNYMLTFTRDTAGDQNIRAIVFNGGTNAATAEFNAAGNGADDFFGAESTGLNNGNFVTAAVRDPAAGAATIEFKIVNAAGTQIVAPITVATGFQTDVAALTGGGFVVAYTESNDVKFRVATSAGVLGAVVTVASGANSQDSPKVVGLHDGGFFIAWSDSTATDLIGQRYSATGVAIGANLVIDASAASSPTHEVGLTGDGRILVSWFDANIAQVILDPRDSTINGTNAADVLTTRLTEDTIVNGLNGDDTIFGQGGNDTISGGGGTDILFGAGGNDIFKVLEGEFIDQVDGGLGTDTLDLSAITSKSATIDFGGQTYDLSVPFAGPANFVAMEKAIGTGLGDTIIGAAGTQVIEGRDGGDTITGGADSDNIKGDGGDDSIDGGGGNDAMAGGTGDDGYVVDLAGDTVTELFNEGIDSVTSGITLTLSVNVENLTLSGAAGNSGTGNGSNNVITGNGAGNTLTGLDGSDTLDGAGGADTMVGGLGNDTYVVGSAGETATELAGQGTDEVRSSVTFSIAALANLENVTLTGVLAANATGNAGVNALAGNTAANVIDGGAGNDTVSGDAGSDILRGGAGEDTLNGGTEADDVRAGADNDTIDGGDGNDIVLAGEDGDDTVNGGIGADRIDGAIGVDTLNGEAGNDTITGGDGVDVIDGGSEDDIIYGQAGRDTVSGNTGKDTIYGGDEVGAGDLALNGDAGDDHIQGGLGDDLINGNGDNDKLFGEGGADTADGGSGLDRLEGGAGDDILDGQGGNDVMVGGTENDTMSGGQDVDRLEGGAGDDTLDGGTQNDNLTGGTGLDTFNFEAATGSEAVFDFTDNVDTLQVDASYGFADAAAVVAATISSAGNARIILGGGNQIFLMSYIANGNTVASLIDDIVIA